MLQSYKKPELPSCSLVLSLRSSWDPRAKPFVCSQGPNATLDTIRFEMSGRGDCATSGIAS